VEEVRCVFCEKKESFQIGIIIWINIRFQNVNIKLLRYEKCCTLWNRLLCFVE
jgi:hypothetical protein